MALALISPIQVITKHICSPSIANANFCQDDASGVVIELIYCSSDEGVFFEALIRGFCMCGVKEGKGR